MVEEGRCLQTRRRPFGFALGEAGFEPTIGRTTVRPFISPLL